MEFEIEEIKTTELIKVTIPSPINTTSIITNNPKEAQAYRDFYINLHTNNKD